MGRRRETMMNEDKDRDMMIRVMQIVQDLTEYLESRTTIGTAYSAGVLFSAGAALTGNISKEEFLDYAASAWDFAKAGMDAVDNDE